MPEGAVVQYLRDGKTATISLIEKDGLVTIATNGKPDAGIQMGPGEPSVDETTMVLAAAIPLSMQPASAARCQHRVRLGPDDAHAPGERAHRSPRFDRDRALHGGGCPQGLRPANPERLRGSAQSRRLRRRQDLFREHARALRPHRVRAVQSVGERRLDLVLGRILRADHTLPHARRIFRSVGAGVRDQHRRPGLDHQGARSALRHLHALQRRRSRHLDRRDPRHGAGNPGRGTPRAPRCFARSWSGSASAPSRIFSRARSGTTARSVRCSRPYPSRPTRIFIPSWICMRRARAT